MLEFLRRLFAPEPRSSETAKERLRLVLLSDHLSLAPDVVEALKRDLLEVISRYLEIDPAQADVTFEQREREVAMLASIPIVGVRERTSARAAVAVAEPPGEVSARSPEAVAQPEEPEAATRDALGEAPDATPAEAPAEARAQASQATSARRRRRKKAAAARLPQAAPAPGFGPA